MNATTASRLAPARAHAPGVAAQERGAALVARLERLPVTRPVLWARGCGGMATFFDGYTTIALAYAMPILAKEWSLTPSATAAIISAGYLGQLVGAIFFGWLAERIGRLPVLAIAIGIFAAMSCRLHLLLERLVAHPVPLPSGHRHRRRSSRRQRVRQ